MTSLIVRFMRPALTFAGSILEGDIIVLDGEELPVEKIRRAQGRKPREGENLRFTTPGGARTLNSLAPVRVIRSNRSASTRP
jgi:hypothetical protein